MDQLNFAIQVLVIGFTVVFVTLFMLYGVLLLFSYLFYKKEEDKSINQKESLLSGEKTFEAVADSVDSKVIAVITAAISEYMQHDENFKKTASVSIYSDKARSSIVDNWKIIGRKALMENRAVLEKIRRKRRVEKI